MFCGFLRVLTLSLLTAACAFSSLHAQTVAYVANSDSTNVSVIDTASNTVTATIPVGAVPAGIAFSPDGAIAYVTSEEDGTISVINTATNTVTATITLGGSPRFLAITPDGNTLYVPCGAGIGGPPPESVQVVSTATNSVTAVIPLVPLGQFEAVAAAITPDGKHAYVETRDFGLQLNVVVIDTATNTTTVVVPGIAGNGGQTGPGIAITPSGGTVYVAAAFAPVVTAISTVNNTVIGTIPTADGPTGIAITPDGSRVYVADRAAGAVTVIDTASNTAVATITPFFGPSAVAITPDGASAYVTDSATSSVSVIATATNTIVATVPVGTGPRAVATTILSTPFAAFTIDNLNISPQGFHEQGDFTLGANSEGVDLAHQLVKLTIGSFSLTIPAGSFRQLGGNHHFVLNATINGLQVDFNLTANHGSSTDFSYVVNVHGVDLTSQPDPVTVGLTIGHNTGTTTVQF
jgi:YVTN family beta-propeller protein